MLILTFKSIFVLSSLSVIFFFSHDNKFIKKTIRGKEKGNLLKMLDKMINHFQRNKNKSLITRIYGLFTIKSNVFVDLDVIIM